MLSSRLVALFQAAIPSAVILLAAMTVVMSRPTVKIAGELSSTQSYLHSLKLQAKDAYEEFKRKHANLLPRDAFDTFEEYAEETIEFGHNSFIRSLPRVYMINVNLWSVETPGQIMQDLVRTLNLFAFEYKVAVGHVSQAECDRDIGVDDHLPGLCNTLKAIDKTTSQLELATKRDMNINVRRHNFPRRRHQNPLVYDLVVLYLLKRQTEHLRHRVTHVLTKLEH